MIDRSPHSRKTSASQWLKRSHSGYCNATQSGDEGDCDAGSKGVLLLDAGLRAGQGAFAQACMAACEACARCRHVSLSETHQDCSWYYD